LKIKNYCYFYTKIEDTSFQNDIINIIDQSDDVQQKTTNVKAKMTDWNMQNKLGFKTLATHMINFASIISEKRYKKKEEFYFTSMWGMCYESEDYTITHDHWPSIWSCVYYINPPINCGELIFPEINEYIVPEDKLLVLFPGWVVHNVPKKQFVGKRYVVSGNLGIMSNY